MPEKLFACHTALIEGYVIEGHVPADLIDKLLKEKPQVLGLAVPGMPVGSPGMEGGKPEPYDSFDLRQERPDDCICDAVEERSAGVME